jgi:hypothetical protein
MSTHPTERPGSPAATGQGPADAVAPADRSVEQGLVDRPDLGRLLAVVEAALIATVVLTALYASTRISDRTFRMPPRATPPQA